MLNLRQSMLVVAAAMMTQAQPALTTIRDIRYRAGGTRFNREIFISWNAFQAGATANIATSQLKLPIMKDVLVSEGTAVRGGGGPSPITIAPVQISDVGGLAAALAVDAQKGAAFAIGHAAMINSSGQIDGASGNLCDCLHVDGSSGPSGGGGGGSGFPIRYPNGDLLGFSCTAGPTHQISNYYAAAFMNPVQQGIFQSGTSPNICVDSGVGGGPPTCLPAPPH